MNTMVISFEDQPAPAKRMLDAIASRVPGIAATVVAYRDKQGVVRREVDVAQEAFHCASGQGWPCVFLVDLYAFPESGDKTYGLRVIAKLGALFGRSPEEFLRDINFLIIVPTSYPTVGPSDVRAAWGREPVELRIKRILNERDMREFVVEHSSNAVLAVVEKNSKEALLPCGVDEFVRLMRPTGS